MHVINFKFCDFDKCIVELSEMNEQYPDSENERHLHCILIMYRILFICLIIMTEQAQ